MGTELPTNVMLGQTLVLMQMTFLNNVRKVCRLVPSRTSCYISEFTTSHSIVSHEVTYIRNYLQCPVENVLPFFTQDQKHSIRDHII
jgi:hypothetical protein